ncbi:hypothetical protein KVT40_004956 [Elsinoe batatas]|uniref:DUF7729 domain-containing protein n=1 Tax=Elsinoe batatas TaxID=2601811 RepID=A0A8K0L843_9PEZI|nr:hypothetical protein KVT40_004956 [Elsinoe batatas]
MAEHTFLRERSCSHQDSFSNQYTLCLGHTRRSLCRYPITTYDQPISLITILLFLLALALPFASASIIPNNLPPTGEVLTAEEIIFDHSPPPARDLLLKRSSPSDSIISDTSLPTPFDTTLGNNFTSAACLPFFQSFLSNATFSACLPFSLLLQTSSSFFQTIRQPARLTRTLDATCNVNVTDCSLLMGALNTQLRSQAVCGADLSLGNPVVIQAANGFAAYDVLYRAACLKSRLPSPSPSSSSLVPTSPSSSGNPSPSSSSSSSSSSAAASTGSQYCFSLAATNFSAPDSMYTYFLPMGMKLPPDAHPACTGCLKDTMAGFAQSATQKGQGVAGTYEAAAATVDKWCGEGFVRRGVGVGSRNAASRGMGEGWWWWVGMVGSVGWVVW